MSADTGQTAICPFIWLRASRVAATDRWAHLIDRRSNSEQWEWLYLPIEITIQRQTVAAGNRAERTTVIGVHTLLTRSFECPPSTTNSENVHTSIAYHFQYCLIVYEMDVAVRLENFNLIEILVPSRSVECHHHVWSPVFNEVIWDATL